MIIQNGLSVPFSVPFSSVRSLSVPFMDLSVPFMDLSLPFSSFHCLSAPCGAFQCLATPQETDFKRHITTKKQFILRVFNLKSSKFLTNSPHPGPSVDIDISLIFLQNFQRISGYSMT